MSDTIQQMAELLLKNSLENVQQEITKRLEETEASFYAKLDGLKVALNEQIGIIEAIAGETPLSMTIGTVEEHKRQLVHSAFIDCLNILKSQKRIQKNIMFVGEAGSGKTHLASCVAEALGLKFYPMSVGLQTTKSDLLGFINAHGQYVTSPVRQAFENGGVLLLDEFDSAHAGVVTIINSLLANGHCSFPDAVIEKHKDFICIVACNTYGHGANVDYVGRNRLDGATLDRFIVLNVGYDKKLEKKLTNNDYWLGIINKIRKNVSDQGIKMIISPRASMNGADLLEAGFNIKDVVDMCILKGADKDTREKCLKGISLIDETSKTTTETIKSEYVRNLETTQTYIIRTEDESFNSFISYQALNDIIQKDYLQYFNNEYCRIHLGSQWVPEFDGNDSIYFSSKPEFVSNPYRFDYPSQSYIQTVFQTIENEKPKSLDKPIAFEFIAKGCRNPWKVITL